MTNRNTYSENNIVKWHHVDIRQELKPYAFLNMMQEIAGNHANTLKFGYDTLQESNQIWVLSRIKVRFMEYPQWGEHLSLETWHKGMQSLFGLRDFILHKEDGTKAVCATSSWLIMNAKTRRIERNNVFNSNSEILNNGNKTNAIETSCDKLKPQSEMEFVREHTVMYSDIDNLMHTNNAKYIEWIIDSINFDIIKTHRIKEFQINYNAETKLGEKIEIYRKEIATPQDVKLANDLDNNSRTFYFEGRKDGKCAFESIFTLVAVE